MLKVGTSNNLNEETLTQSPTGDCRNDTYTSAIGLNFVVYCSHDVTTQQNYTSGTGANITDCMEQCSRSQPRSGDLYPCSIAVFDGKQGSCFFFTNATPLSSSELTYSSANVTAAVADSGQLTIGTAAIACQNQTLYSAVNGYEFQTECGLDASYADFNDDTSKNPYYAWHHASSLQECINWCAQGTPLCYAVSYNADARLGYRNCYPKSANVSEHVAPLPENLREAVVHTAIGQLIYDSTPCQPGTYNASGGAVYGRTCDSYVDEPDIGHVYQATFDGCIDYCSTYRNGSQTCTIALYQPLASSGYENCRLKSPSTKYYPYSQNGWHFAVLASSGLVTSPGTDTVTTSSKLWIAGAVIGPLAVIALLVAFLIWRRKRSRKASTSQMTENRNEAAGVPYHGKPVSEIQYSPVPPRELSDGVVYASQRNRLNVKHELPSDAAAQRNTQNGHYALP